MQFCMPINYADFLKIDSKQMTNQFGTMVIIGKILSVWKSQVHQSLGMANHMQLTIQTLQLAKSLPTQVVFQSLIWN